MNNQIESNLKIADIINKLKNTVSKKQQHKLTKELLLLGYEGEHALLDLLINRRLHSQVNLAYLDSIIFECLFYSSSSSITDLLNYHFSNGLVDLTNNSSIDYQPLQNLLKMGRYQEADKLTQVKLCELAGLDVMRTRDWLYFTDIPFLPSEDLITIDVLWQVYSREKFGFSKQRQIWLSHNGNWEKFWQQIGWKINGVPRRYPSEFLWDISAPVGHLPLFNQLRGVQVLSALFNHTVWSK